MTLTKFRISGFKSLGPSFQELLLQADATVLIGPNGAGKSNILGAMTFLGQVVRGNLQTVVEGASQLLYQGPKVSPFMDFEVWGLAQHASMDHLNGYKAVLAHLPAEDRLRFQSEEVFYWDKTQHPQKPYGYQLGTAHRESKLEAPPSEAEPIASYVRKNALGWRVFHFHDTSPLSPPKQTCHIDSGATLRSDAGNLASFLFRLQENEPKHYGWIRDTIRQVAPFFEDFNLVPSSKGQLRLLWRQRGMESTLGPDQISDGTLRFMCLATLLLQPSPPSVVLLDEPELGLHPFALNLLGELIRSASSRCQILCSTQSSALVNHFDATQIRVVENGRAGTYIKPVTAEELGPWLEDYSLGQIWEMNLIGGRP